MDTVLVTGGTGHLGRDLVGVLKDGYRVRVLARTPGQDPAVEWVRGDLDTGVGITEAVAGAQVIVHAATFSPAARRGFLLPTDFPGVPLTSMSRGRTGCLRQPKPPPSGTSSTCRSSVWSAHGSRTRG